MLEVAFLIGEFLFCPLCDDRVVGYGVEEPCAVDADGVLQFDLVVAERDTFVSIDGGLGHGNDRVAQLKGFSIGEGEDIA